MKTSLTLLFLLFAAVISFGKHLSGRIQSDGDGTLLADVAIINLRHPEIGAVSDANGKYSIRADKGDSIQFSLVGYTPRILLYTGDNEYWFETVLMRVRSMVLDTVVVGRELSKREVDSFANRAFYDKPLNFKPAKVKYSFKENPFVVQNPISGLIEKHTRYAKKLKRFKQIYNEQEVLSFIDARYPPELITQLTGLKEDSLYRFMQAYPMSYDYAKQASDLEIKMWIKYNYKSWTQNNGSEAADTLANRADSKTIRKP
jgi:hypothetical protein